MPEPASVPSIRVRQANDSKVRADGKFVLYWMVAFRRGEDNFALQHAIDWAQDTGKPLVILEALRAGYRWNSDRMHAFVIQGMRDNAEWFGGKQVLYYPYLEKQPGDGKGLLEALARNASVVVTDDYPCFFVPRMINAVANRIDVRMDMVDSNGLYPLRDTDRVFKRAHDFRRHLQKNLLPHLHEMPRANPFNGISLGDPLDRLPSSIEKQWPAADLGQFDDGWGPLKKFEIDHSVKVAPLPGGAVAAQERLSRFIEQKLSRYEDDRNQPEQDVASGLSPYLHFGHIASQRIFRAVAEREDWDPGQVAEKANGSSSGWWGMSGPAESFLDELITWREVGFNFTSHRDDYDQFGSLPDWALKTIREHADDHREHVYSLKEFESAETHDPLWNAAQWQLVSTGVIHNYLRMLWGKKIYEWSASAEDALEVMIELNNKYALDGRDPNSYSGIFWVLGRYDRAWGPERDVFGKLRYMTSENTARKVRVKNYIREYSPPDSETDPA